MKRLHLLSAIATAALLASCGGGGDGGNGFAFIGAGTGTGTGGGGTVTTGALQEPPVIVTTLSAAQIDGASAQSGLQAISGKARCDVNVISLNYTTVGPKGEATNASGVLLMPAGSCASGAPLVAYAKGTDVQKPRTLVNPQDPETFTLTAMYAAQGYAVVATDYLGYAKSTFPYHPYLHADSEARTVLDSVRAARAAVASAGGSLSGKVMITGYSQGGHSSMSAHRAAERDNAAEINVVAGAHLAGPYNLSGSFKVTQAIAGYQYFVPMIVNSYQRVYGDVYTDINTVYKLPYANYMDNLLPSPTLNYTTLLTTGTLPGGTPNQARDALFQAAYIADVQTNPNNALYLDAKKNDLFGWNPKAKTLLCGGAGDPTVPPAVHMVPMKADFDSRGVTTVTTVDVDAQIQATFGPGGRAPTDPTTAAYATYYGAYHGTYEPPFCHARARALFDTVK
ncbi:lipase family protein [Variovorax sp. KK3]|uniref:lipase family protein n=1 Tax=Variovorax sp. KK3 TaxID=1855728 RepID=UPI00097C46E9|nr:lipase family protein [Variovorax sp. KK3]